MTRIITRADDGRVDRVFTAVYCFFQTISQKPMQLRSPNSSSSRNTMFSLRHVPASACRWTLGFPGVSECLHSYECRLFQFYLFYFRSSSSRHAEQKDTAARVESREFVGARYNNLYSHTRCSKQIKQIQVGKIQVTQIMQLLN